MTGENNNEGRNLCEWLRENGGVLYGKYVLARSPDEARQILNKATGLEILSMDLISESENKYLERLKEMKAKGEL
jgi:hypothetical protein